MSVKPPLSEEKERMGRNKFGMLKVAREGEELYCCELGSDTIKEGERI